MQICKNRLTFPEISLLRCRGQTDLGQYAAVCRSIVSEVLGETSRMHCTIQARLLSRPLNSFRRRIPPKHENR
jgi:hypothetical protein